MPTRVLIVEDDADINHIVATRLAREGYACTQAYSGTEARLLLQAGAAGEAPEPLPFDLVVCDLMLPGLTGEELTALVRERTDVVPIIVISARSEDSDKVAALDAGADDYLTKPFSVDELLARLRVALRRVRYDSQKVSEEASLYENGNLKIDYAAGCAYRDGVEIHLTPIEYKLLCLLARNTGKVLTHNFILNEIWGSSAFSDTPSLRVFMATLRKKLEVDPSHPQYIQTHIGVGYRMIRQKQEDEA